MKSFLMVAVSLVLCYGPTFAQVNVSGKVVDATSSKPLPGVSIVAIKSQTGTVTGSDGTFTLTLNKQADTLVISFIGYQPKKVAVTEAPLYISLTPFTSSLNELVVTAGRTLVQRTEVPVAISVISAKMLQQTKAVTLDQVLNKVSGVYMVDLGNEQHTMAIRQPISYRSNFLYLQDGIPLHTIGDFNHNALIEINQAALRRIEVIKGPSSSLYGSDAVGGAINFITKTPPKDAALDLALEGTTGGYKRTNLTVGNTWNKTGLLLSGYFANRRHGYRQHSDFDKLALTMRADHQIDKKNTLTAMVTGIDYRTDMTGGLDSAHFYGKDYHSFYTFNYRKVKAWRARLGWKHQEGKQWHSQLIFYYRNNQIGQNPHYRIRATDDPLKASGEINKDFFQSYGLQGQYFKNFKKWNTALLAGFQAEYSPAGYLAHFIRIAKNRAGYFVHYAVTDSLLTDYRVAIYNEAAYLRLQSMPLRRLRMVVGLRYDRLDYRFDNFLLPSAYSGSPDGSNHFHQFSPKVGMTYDFGKDRGVYANYSIGFVPPDIGDLYTGVKIPSLQSARYFNYEVGGWLAFDHYKGNAEVSLYRMKGRNEVVTVRRADGSYTNKNAGETLHYGIEYTFNYHPVSPWKFRLSGTNARHLFVQYEEKGNDYSDKEMNGAPHWIAHAQVTFLPRFVKGLNVSLEWQHLSSYYMDPANTQRYKGYNLWNARANYTYKKFEFWMHLTNVFNTLYATTAEKTAYATTYRPGSPRTLQIGVSYHLTKRVPRLAEVPAD